MRDIILITGAFGNLGKSIMKHYLQLGWEVIGIVSKRDDPKKNSQDGIHVFSCDLTDATETQEIILKAINQVGMPATAVYTAGGFSMGDLEETGIADIHRMIALNFATAYNPARILIRHANDNQKWIKNIFIGARPGIFPEISGDMVAYGISKSMLITFAKIINFSNSQKYAKAAVVIPSIIDTASNRAAMPGADFSKWITPDQISRKIVELESMASITQENFLVEKFNA